MVKTVLGKSSRPTCKLSPPNEATKVSGADALERPTSHASHKARCTEIPRLCILNLFTQSQTRPCCRIMPAMHATPHQPISTTWNAAFAQGMNFALTQASMHRETSIVHFDPSFCAPTKASMHRETSIVHFDPSLCEPTKASMHRETSIVHIHLDLVVQLSLPFGPP